MLSMAIFNAFGSRFLASIAEIKVIFPIFAAVFQTNKLELNYGFK